MANEVRLLLLAAALFESGRRTFHGYAISAELERLVGPRMSYSTVYRCLDRLEEMGLVEGEWDTGDRQGPPRRRYQLTPNGFERVAELRLSPDAPTVEWQVP